MSKAPTRARVALLVAARVALLVAAAMLLALAGCSAPSDVEATPEPTPTRTLSTVCHRGSYAPPLNKVTLDVTCEGAPVHTGLRCGESAELPADVECSLQALKSGAPIYGPYAIEAGSDPVFVRVAL